MYAISSTAAFVDLRSTRTSREHRAVTMVKSSTHIASFDAFYSSQIESLTRALTVSLADAQLAQDAAQESMARAFQHWSKVEKYDNPTGWCYRVASNWATSRWRKRKREVLADRFDTQSTTDAQPIHADYLVDALMQLNKGQRDVIVLRLIEDWSIEDTAAALDVAPGTVQSRYSRALQKLRSIVEEPDA